MEEEMILKRIVIDPQVCHGKPCIRGLRYPVGAILEYLAGGDSVADILEAFPDLDEADTLACQLYANWN
ncbi:MAG: DUF433 domain-containing protein [bacterium]|nr:DUF433 domain-containing protein [bacterium]